MSITSTHVVTHVLVGFANPFLVCVDCDARVPYWHDPDRCGCNGEAFNSPCGHKLDITSKCPSWSPVDGCRCINQETHDKE